MSDHTVRAERGDVIPKGDMSGERTDRAIATAQALARENRAALEAMRTRREQLTRDVKRERREWERLRGQVLGRNVPDAEPVITHAIWFEFLLEHPELTGWAT